MSEWVTDPEALQIILELRALEPGDELRWYRANLGLTSEKVTVLVSEFQVSAVLSYYARHQAFDLEPQWVITGWRRR